MRTVAALSRLKGKVYVYLCNDTIRKKFLQDAEGEGFMFGDGVLPTNRPDNDIYVVNPDHTIHFPGFAGHRAFHNNIKVIGNEILLRIDYEKYILGFDDYLIEE